MAKRIFAQDFSWCSPILHESRLCTWAPGHEPHGAAGLTFAAFVKLAVQEHDVLPVAVCSHSSVCTFPGEYVLREDDRLLVLARQPSDVAAFERWVARNAWEELMRTASPRYCRCTNSLDQHQRRGT